MIGTSEAEIYRCGNQRARRTGIPVPVNDHDACTVVCSLFHLFADTIMQHNVRRDGEFSLPDISTLPPDGGPEFNRLVFSASPYLLQHARNPVDWYPWCDEAFERAERENKPVFLSIGYSTCHWCHVMEHESFENADIASLLNERFIAIKVDREERPDIDQIYMTVCQAMTGSGGWPLSVFLTPDKLPFYAGTYFPPEDRHGRPGFSRILMALHDAWHNERARVLGIGADLRDSLQRAARREQSELPDDMLARAEQAFRRSFDPVFGGFGDAPKFPMPHTLSFLLRRAHVTGSEELLGMVMHTLRRMWHGGLWDHVGGGFCRYSTDRRWLVPHFEKMLYDNALMLEAYADAYALTRDEEFAQVCRDIARYLHEYMMAPEGYFHSAENADSEGEEGLFYVFTREEFRGIVDPAWLPALEEYYGVSASGNFEHGRNILHIAVDRSEWMTRNGLTSEHAAALLADTRARLHAYRAQRVHPSLDDKVLVSWNGLMIAGLARAGRILNDATMIAMAERAATALLQSALLEDARLLHRLRGETRGIAAFLDDYAYLIHGLLELYQSTFALEMLEHAIALARFMVEAFTDAASGAMRFSSDENERLIAENIDFHDGALPSGNGMAAVVLMNLARLTGDMEWEGRAWNILRAASSSMQAYPTGSAMLLRALHSAREGGMEIVIAAEDEAPWREAIRGRLLDRVRLLHRPRRHAEAVARIAPFTAKLPMDGEDAVYVCRDYTCDAPLRDVGEFIAVLDARENARA